MAKKIIPIELYNEIESSTMLLHKLKLPIDLFDGLYKNEIIKYQKRISQIKQIEKRLLKTKQILKN